MKYRFEIHDNDEIYTLQTDHYDSIDRFHDAVLAEKHDPAFDFKISMEIPADYRHPSWDEMQQRNQANAQPLEDAATPNVRGDDEGWIEHDGSANPISIPCKIDIRMRDGREDHNVYSGNYRFLSKELTRGDDITHYRLHKGD
jgi:hypothetical protein